MLQRTRACLSLQVADEGNAREGTLMAASIFWVSSPTSRSVGCTRASSTTACGVAHPKLSDDMPEAMAAPSLAEADALFLVKH